MKDDFQSRAFFEIKRFMIQSSRDFSCPITGEILDVNRSEIIRVNNDPKKDFIVSLNGWNKLKSAKLKPGFNIEKLTEETI